MIFCLVLFKLNIQLKQHHSYIVIDSKCSSGVFRKIQPYSIMAMLKKKKSTIQKVMSQCPCPSLVYSLWVGVTDFPSSIICSLIRCEDKAFKKLMSNFGSSRSEESCSAVLELLERVTRLHKQLELKESQAEINMDQVQPNSVIPHPRVGFCGATCPLLDLFLWKVLLLILFCLPSIPSLFVALHGVKLD